jgi:hypothetical protein
MGERLEVAADAARRRKWSLRGGCAGLPSFVVVFYLNNQGEL